jgi:thioredoxin-like negative regulator of GroEL
MYITFLNVNVEELPLIGAKYFVRSLPTVIFFINSKAHSSLTGTVHKKIIENKILSFLPGQR